MNKKGRRWKGNSRSYTVYAVCEVERNSRDETVERAPLQDRCRSGWLCDLEIGVDVSPKRRDHAQHPDRRCDQDSNEDCRCAKPCETRISGGPASEIIKRSEPHQFATSLKLGHQILQINAD